MALNFQTIFGTYIASTLLRWPLLSACSTYPTSLRSQSDFPDFDSSRKKINQTPNSFVHLYHPCTYPCVLSLRTRLSFILRCVLLQPTQERITRDTKHPTVLDGGESGASRELV